MDTVSASKIKHRKVIQLNRQPAVPVPEPIRHWVINNARPKEQKHQHRDDSPSFCDTPWESQTSTHNLEKSVEEKVVERQDISSRRRIDQGDGFSHMSQNRKVQVSYETVT
jgi:hypothetical protein